MIMMTMVMTMTNDDYHSDNYNDGKSDIDGDTEAILFMKTILTTMPVILINNFVIPIPLVTARSAGLVFFN